MVHHPDYIGAYRVLGLLGEGSFGKVFLVEDHGEKKALKLFVPINTGQPLFRKLFEKEFLTLKTHHHPLIIRVDDFGWDKETQAPYFTSEFIQGIPLHQGFQSATPDKQVFWIFQILRALHFLHQHDLCHRDLKPENILIIEGNIKLIDFGLAGLEKELPAGTRPYMAPEIFNREPYTSRGDLYSLGVTLYQSIFGKLPVKEKKLSFPVSKVQPLVTSLLTSLMESSPQKRPSALEAVSMLLPLLSSREVFQDLQHEFLEALKEPFYIDSKEYLVQIEQAMKEANGLTIFKIIGEKGTGKSRLLNEVKTTALLHHLKIYEELVDPWEYQKEGGIILLDKEDQESGDEELSLWMKKWHLLPPLDSQNQKKNLLFVASNLPDKNPQKEIKILCLTPWREKEIYTLLSRLVPYPVKKVNQEELIQKTQGIPLYVLCLLGEMIRKESGLIFDDRLFNETLRSFSDDYRVSKMKNSIDLKKSNNELLHLSEKALAKDQPKKALTFLGQIKPEELETDQEEYLMLIAEVSLKTGNSGEALVHFKKLEQIVSPSKKLLFLERMGLALLRHGQYLQAEEVFNRVLQEKLKLPETIRIQNYLAQVYFKKGNFTVAEKIFSENWNLFETKLNKEEQTTITNFNGLAVYLADQKYEECLSQGCKELEYYQHLNKPEAMARTLYNLGESLYQLKRPKEALKHWQQGIEVAQKIGNDELLLRFCNGLGNLLFEEYQDEEANQYYEKGLYYAYRQEDPSALCRILINLALIRKRANKIDQAKTYLSGAKAYLEQIKNSSERTRLSQFIEQVTVEKKIQFPVSAPRIIFYKKGHAMDTPTNPNFVQAYQSLLHISELIGAERNLTELLKLVLRYAIQLSGAERGAVLLTENEELIVACTQNADKEELLGQISQQIARKVLSHGEMVHTHDASQDDRFSDNKSVILFHLRSILCLPIQALGKTVGVLYLDHTHSPKAFSDFDKEILSTYCHQAGAALENAKLFESLHKKEEELALTLKRVNLEKDQALTELKSEKKQWMGKYRFTSIQSQNPKIFELFETLEPIIETKIAVMIQGESGTGKELLAKAIHYQSPFKNGPLIVANCGAIPENLVESELFGYKAGAFTGAVKDKKGLFEAANGGTLFLDEIGELPLTAQVKLLRVLQEGEVLPIGETKPRKIDIRLISATHQNLNQLVYDKKFREDLYYRICEFTIETPPLRERKDDIPFLAKVFIDEYREENKIKQEIQLSPQILSLLMEYSWPGNIRELRNVIRVGCALRKGSKISPDHFPSTYPFLTHAPSSLSSPIPQEEKEHKNSFNPSLTLEDYEKIIYAKAYAHTGFQPKKAYELLGVSSATFFKKIKAWNLNNQANPLYQNAYPYVPSISLEKSLGEIITQTYQHFEKQPYKVIKALQISPGTFYKWKEKQRL